MNKHASLKGQRCLKAHVFRFLKHINNTLILSVYVFLAGGMSLASLSVTCLGEPI